MIGGRFESEGSDVAIESAFDNGKLARDFSENGIPIAAQGNLKKFGVEGDEGERNGDLKIGTGLSQGPLIK